MLPVLGSGLSEASKVEEVHDGDFDIGVCDLVGPETQAAIMPLPCHTTPSTILWGSIRPSPAAELTVAVCSEPCLCPELADKCTSTLYKWPGPWYSVTTTKTRWRHLPAIKIIHVCSKHMWETTREQRKISLSTTKNLGFLQSILFCTVGGISLFFSPSLSLFLCVLW